MPAWQGSGLGRAMLERLVASLVEDGIANITLFAEASAVVGSPHRLLKGARQPHANEQQHV
eukprot:7456324-Pyramimonas_sp.AAC.1